MCNSLISACGADGWELALALLKTMDEASLERDLWSFSGAIKACGEAGHWQKALALFTSQPLGFNEVMASSMVSACAKAKQWQLTLRLIASMSRLRLANAFSYSAAISGQKSWPWALQLITIMSQASVERDLACRNALYLACQNVGAWQQALPRIQESNRRAFRRKTTLQWRCLKLSRFFQKVETLWNLQGCQPRSNWNPLSSLQRLSVWLECSVWDVCLEVLIC